MIDRISSETKSWNAPRSFDDRAADEWWPLLLDQLVDDQDDQRRGHGEHVGDAARRRFFQREGRKAVHETAQPCRRQPRRPAAEKDEHAAGRQCEGQGQQDGHGVHDADGLRERGAARAPRVSSDVFHITLMPPGRHVEVVRHENGVSVGHGRGRPMDEPFEEVLIPGSCTRSTATTNASTPARSRGRRAGDRRRARGATKATSGAARAEGSGCAVCIERGGLPTSS